MDHHHYMSEMINGHLNDDTKYKIIPPNMHNSALYQRNIKFLKLYRKYRLQLKREHQIYFDRSLAPEKIKSLKVAQAKGLPKVHKPIKPPSKIPPLRMVITIVNTIAAVFSNYADYILKPFMKKLPSYIKDSNQLRESLHNNSQMASNPEINYFP